MTYIDLINRFWESYRAKKFSDIETTVYFYLLNECNIRRWLNPFELQTRNVEACIGVSRKTIGEVRNQLKQRGLIDFQNGKGRGPTMYLLIGADVTNELLSETFCVSPTKHKGNTRVTQGKHKGNTNANSTLYNKDIRHKEDISPDGDSAQARTRPEEDLFTGLDEGGKKRKSPSRVKPPEPPPPTLEEVKTYFLSQRADERLTDWEREAEMFFYHFSSLGWKTSRGGTIPHWDSRANLWILEHQHNSQINSLTFQTGKANHNESTTTNWRTTPEESLADEQSRLAARVASRRARTGLPGSAEGESDLPF